jgi:hypothetical protein
MTLPSPAPSADQTEAKKPPDSVKRRGMTIGHWLLIVILAALCVDIGIRIVAFRRSSLAAAQSLNSKKAIQQMMDMRRKINDDELKRLEESQKLFQEFEKRIQNTPAPRDPSRGNIIPLIYRDR